MCGRDDDPSTYDPTDEPPEPRASGPRWVQTRLTRCGRCNGRGKYMTFGSGSYGLLRPATLHEISCPICEGTGRVTPIIPI